MELQDADVGVIRGPIESIDISPSRVSIRCGWLAKLTDGGWRLDSEGTDAKFGFAIEIASTPRDIGDGRVGFSVQYNGPVVLFPAGGSKLSRDRVQTT